MAGRTEGRTERWTRRLLLELLTQAGPNAPCRSSSSLLQEKKKDYSPSQKREVERKNKKAKEVGGSTSSGRVGIREREGARG